MSENGHILYCILQIYFKVYPNMSHISEIAILYSKDILNILEYVWLDLYYTYIFKYYIYPVYVVFVNLDCTVYCIILVSGHFLHQ